MSTISGTLPARSRSLSLAWTSDLRIAGAALFGAGALLLMAIITCEALYPFASSTARNEISDLGGTRPPAALVFQPVASIFNGSMMLTGLLLLAGAVILQRAELLGAINLASLGSYFVLGDASPFWALGVGGAERWVAYPILLWTMGFGEYLAGRASTAAEGMASPGR